MQPTFNIYAEHKIMYPPNPYVENNVTYLSTVYVQCICLLYMLNYTKLLMLALNRYVELKMALCKLLTLSLHKF